MNNKLGLDTGRFLCYTLCDIGGLIDFHLYYLKNWVLAVHPQKYGGRGNPPFLYIDSLTTGWICANFI